MQTLLEVVTLDVTGPAVVGLIFFAVLAGALAFVRQVGKMRPNSKSPRE